jgi:hypothetical protein
MNVTQQPKAIDIARRMIQLGQGADARKAYALALQELQGGNQPALELEAALYLFTNGGDYKVAYTTFVRLYQRGLYQDELLPLLTGAFYEPNVKQMKARYEKNCKLLEKYPYLFRKDFPAFEDLPIQFFPFDDKGYIPFDKAEQTFGKYVNFNDTRITRNFFKDLDKPILASDVFSTYELRYLHDNVRKSEWVGKENHVYLHYTDWGIFCAHLQVWNIKPILEEKKVVFLIGDELSQYPIDFKERFGVDYSQYPVQPLGIREIHRLIWHTQLSSHNGGDFFNEIFDGHPNLIMMPSIMMDSIQSCAETIRECIRQNREIEGMKPADGDNTKQPRLMAQLWGLKNVTDKDILVFIYLVQADLRNLDPASRIAPALFFQPHFSNIYFRLSGKGNVAVLDSKQAEHIQKNPMLRAFPYIKTFVPMRRPTTSCAASMKFVCNEMREHIKKDGKSQVPDDLVLDRLLNRTFLIDPEDRFFRDSVLVRFEDGKLNPKATFTALAAFLDLPYTESMTYCSDAGQRDPESYKGNARGFDPTSVYRTYDEYLGPAERYFLEYFMRDAYEYYGYDFNYYDGAPMDMDRVRDLAGRFNIQDGYTLGAWERVFHKIVEDLDLNVPENQKYAEMGKDEIVQQLLEDRSKRIRDYRAYVGEIFLRGLHFVNHNGQPMRMMPKLELDPALLEQPLYH